MESEKIFAHLFECEYPKIEEKLKWKKHPRFPLKVSQYGQIVHLHADYEKWWRILNTRKTALVWEAWTGECLPDYAGLSFRNNNPYDHRIVNLERDRLADRVRLDRQNAFVDATVQEMIRRETQISRYWDLEDYWKLLRIPIRIIKKWRLESPREKKRAKAKKAAAIRKTTRSKKSSVNI